MAASELYLICEISNAELDAHLARLGAALDAAQVASVLFRPSPGEALNARTLKPLVEAVQAREIAALVADDADLARIVRADGVHLSWAKDQPGRLSAARETMGGRAMIGADAGRSRDDAMTLGEMGADYVGFGIPTHVEDRDTAFARQCVLISWWAEIFEPPCVAFDVSGTDAARDLALAHADFIALTLHSSVTPNDAASLVKDFTSAIGNARIPA